MAGASGDKNLMVLVLVLVSCGMVLTQEDCCTGHDSTLKTDLAKGACVRMSSQFRCNRGYCYPGSRAVDGMYEPPLGRDSRAPDYSSVAHTNKELSPWIQLDLGRSRCVKGVKIWNRDVNGGSILNRFKNPRITVSDNNSTSGWTNVCKASIGTQPAVQYHQCGEIMCGRYVTLVAYKTNNYLNLWEIAVHGY